MWSGRITHAGQEMGSKEIQQTFTGLGREEWVCSDDLCSTFRAWQNRMFYSGLWLTAYICLRNRLAEYHSVNWILRAVFPWHFCHALKKRENLTNPWSGSPLETGCSANASFFFLSGETSLLTPCHLQLLHRPAYSGQNRLPGTSNSAGAEGAVIACLLPASLPFLPSVASSCFGESTLPLADISLLLSHICSTEFPWILSTWEGI